MSKEKSVKPQLLKQSTHTGVMRGRDVRSRLLTRNIDPELRDIIEQLAEINHTNTLAIAELANNFDKMVDIIQSFSDVAENLKNRSEQLMRGTQAETEGDEGAGSVN